MSKSDKAGNDPRELEVDDPVVPFEDAPKDLPGTPEGVQAEFNGESTFQGYADLERITKANSIKNDGVQASLPPWTITTVDQKPIILRLLHFGVGSIRAQQGTETEEVRKALSWPRNRPLPQWGKIEVNARTMCNAIVECTAGSAVDVDGALRANRYRNDGIWYVCPAQLFPGVELQLRHFGHPYITVVESDITEQLKGRMGVRRNKPLPDYARPEVERVMVIHSIMAARGFVMVNESGRKVKKNLEEMSTLELRAFFQKHLLMPADLRGKVPTQREEAEAYFRTMYKSQNPDVLAALVDAQHLIRTAENDEILARGDDFRVGADWDYEVGSAVYKPEKEPQDLTKLNLKDLREVFRASFFPRANLKVRPPKDAESRESHFVGMYRDFNNGLLNELIELEGEIRDLDHDALLEKENDFVVGASDDIAFSE